MCNKVSLTQKSLPLITVVGQNPTSSADSVLLKPINDTHEAQRMSDINQDFNSASVVCKTIRLVGLKKR
jgi:hypothetical protein